MGVRPVATFSVDHVQMLGDAKPGIVRGKGRQWPRELLGLIATGQIDHFSNEVNDTIRQHGERDSQPIFSTSPVRALPVQRRGRCDRSPPSGRAYARGCRWLPQPGEIHLGPSSYVGDA